MAYFKLTNGFEKYDYMTIDEVKAHAARFSQTYKKGFGVWKDNFEAMAQKTVLKRLLTKYAPKSIEMQQMAMFDQSVVKGSVDNMDAATPDYADNRAENVETTDFEEVSDEAVVVDTATGEIKEIETKEEDKLEF
jgi:recombination protein RecT